MFFEPPGFQSTGSMSVYTTLTSIKYNKNLENTIFLKRGDATNGILNPLKA